MAGEESSTRFGDEERLRSAPATRDGGHTGQFTDEEAAFLRQVRFGRLPEPIPPSDWVESVDPDTQYSPPEPRVGEPYGG